MNSLWNIIKQDSHINLWFVKGWVMENLEIKTINITFLDTGLEKYFFLTKFHEQGIAHSVSHLNYIQISGHLCICGDICILIIIA